MELRQLRYFVAVAEERHFGRAAARLLIAQPALSQQIRKLEKQLGADLFTRTTRRVELTMAGEALLVEARRVLAGAERARSVVGRSLRGELGQVRISFVSSAALALLPRLTQALRAEAPDVALTLLERTSGLQLEGLREGGLDVGIVREVSAAAGLALTVLARERLYLAVHHSHRLASRRSVPLAELAGEGFVVFPRQQVSQLYDHIAGLCHAAGFDLEVAQEAVQFTTILGLVAGNAGVAVVPAPLRAVTLPSLRYLALEDEAAVSTVSLAYDPARVEGDPAVRRARDTALRVLRG